MKCDGCGKSQAGVRYSTSGQLAGCWLCRECRTAPQIIDVSFGRQAEWKDFERRNPRFLTRQDELQELMNKVVSRKLDSDSPADRVIFYLGRLGVEDYVEVLLNAGNGYGIAALKLLRSLAERLITMMYLRRNPGEVQDFLEHEYVHQRKIVNHIKAAGGDPSKHFSDSRLQKIEADYQRIKATGRFGTSRDATSWSKLDLASMARLVGLGRHYLGLVFFPTLQLHTTVTALSSRMEATADGTAFKPGAQRREADAALRGAHLCLSVLLHEHIEHFKLAEDAERVAAIYQSCWPAQEDGD